MGINKVILVGNVGRDPETRALPSGTNLTKFTIATSEPRFKDQEGKPHTEWHNIVAWGKLAELCQQYVSKGRQLYIEGRIRRREYEKNGQKTYFTEVHADVVEFLGSRSGGGGEPGHFAEPSYSDSGPSGAGGGGGFPDDGDDVPF